MPKGSAYNKALAFLARREHSVRELTSKLAKKEFPIEEIEEAILRLQKDKYLDNERFIGCLIRARIAQGSGPVKILAEFKAHELSSALVEAHEDWQSADWYELAFKLKNQRFGSEPPEDFKSKCKQMQFLHRRGFSSDHIDYAFSAYV